MSDYAFRFGGLARLYGPDALLRLRTARVLIVGVGGVGSWTAEALARSGVGHLTLVDLDEVCVSNVNRQVPALDGQIGRAKVDVMGERMRAIAPECHVVPRLDFYTPDSAERLLPEGDDRPDVVVDAIDAVANKVRLIARCHQLGIQMIICGGAGGRRDPTQIRITDLVQVTHDRLASEVRKRLRQAHAFPREGKKFGLDCVWSAEPPSSPTASTSSDCEVVENSEAPAAEGGASRRLNCDSGYGSAAFVTGAFGFAAAAWVVQRLTSEQKPPGESPDPSQTSRP